MRLVYDSRYDDDPDTCITSKESSSIRAQSHYLLVATFVMLVLVGIISMFLSDFRSNVTTSTLDGSATQTIHTVVGDNLWSIASNHGVEGVSTYDVVQWIKAENNLQSSALRPGLELVVPAARE